MTKYILTIDIKTWSYIFECLHISEHVWDHAWHPYWGEIEEVFNLHLFSRFPELSQLYKCPFKYHYYLYNTICHFIVWIYFSSSKIFSTEKNQNSHDSWCFNFLTKCFSRIRRLSIAFLNREFVYSHHMTCTEFPHAQFLR